MELRGTTILCVRHKGQVALIGDGQVTMGQSIVMKHTARKVRRIYQKTVEKKINEGLSITPDKTPGEIRQMVDTPVFNQLTALYERARYTEEPISSQELREVGRHHSQ